MKKLYLLLLLFASVNLLGNNVQINNLSIVGDDPINGYAFVQFDLSWDNSWRSEENWDAVWLFVKYRANNGEWRHAWLNNTGNNDGSGTNAVMDIGLKNDKIPYNETTNPGIGCMVYRSTTGSGPFFVTSMQLRWNYRANGVFSSTGIELKVFAIEMVLVPGGPFWVGDGSNSKPLRAINNNSPVQITTEATVVKCDSIIYDDSQLKGPGVWIDGDGGISRTAATNVDINTDFPTGYTGFYCMKYEVSQGQYRDFLNTLTRLQQNSRTQTDISGTNAGNRYVMTNIGSVAFRNGLSCETSLPADGSVEIFCDLDGDGVKNEVNDGEWIACNFLSWFDGVAYLDWSGLRPMTELEFEKACRGPLSPIAGEYPWGTTSINLSDYQLAFPGTAFEGIALYYNTTQGNANCSTNNDNVDGPVRVGIFSANNLNSGRVSSGAGYYGAMELSGNIDDQIIGIGSITGRSFTGLHGDGKLDDNGDADVQQWPNYITGGGGSRGGSWTTNAPLLTTSIRHLSSAQSYYREYDNGIRGCRSIPPTGSGY